MDSGFPGNIPPLKPEFPFLLNDQEQHNNSTNQRNEKKDKKLCMKK
jgi:hypothetical protein